MKQSDLTFTEFTNAFTRMGREDQFSYDGLKALYEYLTEYEEQTGEEIELDVMALCCDYAEHDADSLWNDYGRHIDGIENHEELMRYLEYNTVLIPVGKSDYILQSF
jgi:hypothetical protein